LNLEAICKIPVGMKVVLVKIILTRQSDKPDGRMAFSFLRRKEKAGLYQKKQH